MATTRIIPMHINKGKTMLSTYAMQLHRIPTGLYRQDAVLKVFQEIYWYILYRNSASSKRNFLRSEVLLLQG